MIPVVGGAVAERERHLISRVVHRSLATLLAQLARRSLICLLERIVEAAEAAKAGGKGDLGHRQAALVDQTLGEVQAACLRNSHWRGADVLQEEAIEVTRADTDPGRELTDTSF